MRNRNSGAGPGPGPDGNPGDPDRGQRSRRPPRRQRSRPGQHGRDRLSFGPQRLEQGVILYGWHPVKAALENPARTIRRLFATENAARRLAEDGVELPFAPELVRPDAIA